MAVIPLETIWVNADPDEDGTWPDSVELVSASGLEQVTGVNSRVRDATGDRVIATILPGGSETWQISSVLGLPNEVRWLTANKGRLLCFRDMHGNKVFGFYSDLTVSPFTNHTHFNISFQMTRLDFSEVV